jgi:hypothetical protein
LGEAGQVRQGESSPVVASQARRGATRYVNAWRVRYGMVRQGLICRGKVSQARRGGVRCDAARRGGSGEA